MERELSSNNAALEEANSNYEDAEDALDDMNREMNDVTDSADDMGKEIDEAADSPRKIESKFKGLGTTLKSIGICDGSSCSCSRCGGWPGKLEQEVISAYADYEQLVGGVDTLFKENSQQLQDYASNAYKTAGLSANDYMKPSLRFLQALFLLLEEIQKNR